MPSFEMRSLIPAMGLSVAILTSIGSALAQDRPASVIVDFVDTREISETTPVIGRLVPTVQSDVAARIDGIVDDVTIGVGDVVTAGDIIAALDTEFHTIERRARASAVTEAEAGASVAEAQLRLAEQSLARAERLQGSTAFSQSNFEDFEQGVAQAKATRARAQAAVETAKAELARADYTLRHTDIKSPFDGVVLEKMAQPGQYISTGDPIATLLDLSALEIEADVPSDLVGGLTPGVTVVVAFENTEDAVATVRTAVPNAALTTRTRPVRFTLDLGALDAVRLASGEVATVFVPRGAPREAVTAPKDALVHSSDGWIVYVVEDGTANPRRIAVGSPTVDRVEVRSGLSPGDVVVVRGNERLRPGQAVETRPVSGASQAATEG